MFMNDVNKQEEIRNIATQELRILGVKYRYKKHRLHPQEAKSRKAFHAALHLLPTRTVTLESGQQLAIPKVVHNLCYFVLTKVGTEGLFRKTGSKARQNEIKLSLDAGCSLGEDHNEIDVANVLKTFFRELPEPLIPLPYHELFLKCVLLTENLRLNAVLTACLLLPIEHLNTLTYFMQFLELVASQHLHNKMTAYNLAVVFGPTLLPPDAKFVQSQDATYRLAKTAEVVQLLIENGGKIGALSERIIGQMPVEKSREAADRETTGSAGGGGDGYRKKKKKRRSGSLTRMFNGLKKIVGGKEAPAATQNTPDLLLTPILTKSGKKRKMEANGISQKTRREIINSLPQATTLGTPLLNTRTPISNHPNVKKTVTPDSSIKTNAQTKNQSTKEKKSQWYSRSKLPKNVPEDEMARSNVPKLMLERRWSAVSQVAAFKRSRKRLSMAANLGLNAQNNKVSKSKINTVQNGTDAYAIKEDTCEAQNDSVESVSDFVRISKNEYEDIKSRVTEIERRISVELDSAKDVKPDAATDVQIVYEQTLQDADPQSPTTDQLAKRFSRELKIRRSTEPKIIRSPSARKIGGLRRKSRERQMTGTKLNRNQSWHVTTNSYIKNYSDNDVKKPDVIPKSVNISEPVIATRRLTRTSSLSISTKSVSSFKSAFSNGSLLSDKWTSAEGFFHNVNTPNSSLESCRASIAKLRSQNAGMVLAKARLFDRIDANPTPNTTSPSPTAPPLPLRRRAQPLPHSKPTNTNHALPPTANHVAPPTNTNHIAPPTNTNHITPPTNTNHVAPPTNTNRVAPPTTATTTVKIGAERDRQSHRIRALKMEERRGNVAGGRKSVSPRKYRVVAQAAFTRTSPGGVGSGGGSGSRVVHRRRLELLKENASNEVLTDRKQITFKSEIGDIVPSPKTPRNMPTIKRSLNTRSPRRMNRTPAKTEYLKTPLKVLNTPLSVRQ